MKAIVLRTFGGPAAMEITDWPDPVPGDDQILIRVRAVSANRIDLDVSNGKGPGQVRLPLIPGIDPAGEVAAMGAGAADFRPGERVVVKPSIPCRACRSCLQGEEHACPHSANVGVHLPGGFAEYVAVPARNVYRIPPALTFEEASALSHSFPVVLSMLSEARFTPDDVVLVTGAAGAIGSAAVQVVRHFGARVIAATGSEEKARLALDLGAHAAVDYAADPRWGDAVRRVAGEGGVTLMIQTSGNSEVWQEAVRTIGRRARVVVCGSHGGEVVPLDLRWLFRQRITIMGSAGSTHAAFQEALRLAGETGLRPVIHRVLPLSALREAFGILERRENRGKVILRVAA